MRDIVRKEEVELKQNVICEKLVTTWGKSGLVISRTYLGYGIVSSMSIAHKSCIHHSSLGTGNSFFSFDSVLCLVSQKGLFISFIGVCLFKPLCVFFVIGRLCNVILPLGRRKTLSDFLTEVISGYNKITVDPSDVIRAYKAIVEDVIGHDLLV